MGNELSEELRRFIKEYISSLEQLETLLLLYSAPDRSWAIEDVFKVIQSNPHSVADRLKGLAACGFVTAEGEGTAHPLYRYHPGSAEKAGRVSELQQAYAVSKYKVIDAIFSVPKPPRDPAQQFADSFKLGGKK